MIIYLDDRQVHFRGNIYEEDTAVYYQVYADRANPIANIQAKRFAFVSAKVPAEVRCSLSWLANTLFQDLIRHNIILTFNRDNARQDGTQRRARYSWIISV